MLIIPQWKRRNVYYRKVTALDAFDRLLRKGSNYICVLLTGKKSSVLVTTGSDFSLTCMEELSEAMKIEVRPCTISACAVTNDQIKIES